MLIFLGKKLVGANFYAFCNYAMEQWVITQNLWKSMMEYANDQIVSFVHIEDDCASGSLCLTRKVSRSTKLVFDQDDQI